MIPAPDAAPASVTVARTPPNSLLYGLQYLRAFAAIAVVYYHNGGPKGSDFALGQAGVDLFFILSGFLMVSITKPGFRPLRFLGDRARRIVPLYWLATTVAVVASFTGLFPHMVMKPWHVVSSYLFIPCWSPDMPGHVWPLLVPGWTLAYEAAFYIVFAATSFVGGQSRQLSAISMLFILLVGVGRIASSQSAIYTAYTDPLLLEFVAGGWIGLLWKRPGAWPRWLGVPTILVALVALSFVNDEAYVPWRAAAFGLPCLLIFVSTLAMERRGSIGKAPWLLLLGNASYSIYLFHPFAASVAKELARLLGLYAYQRAHIGLALGIGVGVAAYLLIEKPILAQLRRRPFPSVALFARSARPKGL